MMVLPLGFDTVFSINYLLPEWYDIDTTFTISVFYPTTLKVLDMVEKGLLEY